MLSTRHNSNVANEAKTKTIYPLLGADHHLIHSELRLPPLDLQLRLPPQDVQLDLPPQE